MNEITIVLKLTKLNHIIIIIIIIKHIIKIELIPSKRTHKAF